MPFDGRHYVRSDLEVAMTDRQAAWAGLNDAKVAWADRFQSHYSRWIAARAAYRIACDRINQGLID